MIRAVAVVFSLLSDLICWIGLAARSQRSKEAEILFLRRQLALYVERGVRPRRIDAATRVSLALLSRLFEWRSALVVVRPQTLIGWHRAGFRMLWRWKSRQGRPRILVELRQLIQRMVRENPLWGQERIANEPWLKLGLKVSPRTVRKYWPRPPPGRGDQRWSTFLRNHAQAFVACDFFVTLTSTFRMLYVFVVIEHRSRKVIHCGVTAHPSASWTLQQLRGAIGYDGGYEVLIHDCDSIFARHLDESIERLGIRVLKTPSHCPMANAICERVIGTIRRECLDWLIPLSEAHLRWILKSWIGHYNRARTHMALGPGVPDPPADTAMTTDSYSRHHLPGPCAVRAQAVLGGLHHEYSLAHP